MDVDWDHELPADKTCRYLENLSHTQVAHDWPYLAPEVRRRQIEDFASRNADGIKRSRVGFSDARNQLGSLCHWRIDSSDMNGGRAAIDDAKAEARGFTFLGGGCCMFCAMTVPSSPLSAEIGRAN